MKVCHYPNVSLPGARPAVSLGNFDGVHLGHQRAMALLKERAKARGEPSMAITFEPHPISVLRPEMAPRRILSPALKEELLGRLGLDYLLVVPFTREFSRIGPSDFVETVLVGKLQVSELVLGANFRFGRERAGDLDFLRAQGEVRGFVVHRVEPALYEGEMVSSSRIRKCLGEGSVEAARAMLGRSYFLDATVGEGDGRGRDMGYPTANLEVSGDMLLGDGVYVTEAELEGVRRRGMTHVGRRPTFGIDERAVETHLFDFDRRIYGLTLRLHFHERIRGTVAFDSAESLKAQLLQDEANARAFFRGPGGNLVL